MKQSNKLFAVFLFLFSSIAESGPDISTITTPGPFGTTTYEYTVINKVGGIASLHIGGSKFQIDLNTVKSQPNWEYTGDGDGGNYVWKTISGSNDTTAELKFSFTTTSAGGTKIFPAKYDLSGDPTLYPFINLSPLPPPIRLQSGGISYHGAASPVPLPSALWLFGSGLMAFLSAADKKSPHRAKPVYRVPLDT